MKKLIYILITASLISVSSGAYGQNDDPVITIFNKYENREGVESVTISPALFSMMQNVNSADSKTREIMSKITGLRILTLKDGDNGIGRANREALTAELQAVVKRDFVEIMRVNSSGDRIELYVRNNTALLFITSATNSITALHLAGTIDKTLIDAVMNGEIGISNK
jgi:hypothetical protein